jgi:A/G-specific adenine glycosylase
VLRELRGSLLAWYRRERRRLPWRESPDPYRVLVSEFMLQQTQVATVVPYFERFMARYPTVRDLAAAPIDDVLAAWSGLGYYRRARNLHAAARRIVDLHGGEVPREERAVRDLPGVGAYTAGALRSIAFGERAAVVDGNVERVLSRLLRMAGPVGKATASRRLWEIAEQLLDPEAPGDFNQALMELGALRCLPAAPDCERCPWDRHCLARAAGVQGKIPRPAARPVTREMRGAAIVLRRAGRVLLVRREEAGELAGMWELPGSGESPVEGEGARKLAAAVRKRHGLSVEVGPRLGEVRHGILDRRIRLELFAAELRGERSVRRSRISSRWVRPEEALAGGLALAASARKALRMVVAGERRAGGRPC